MADYTGVFLTKKGRALQLKAESGVPLNFTKIAIGDGQHDQSQNVEDIEALLHPLQDLWITGIQVQSGQCDIHSSITNEGVTEGFYVRELGLFAYDPDEGEILYAIAIAKEADYLPANGGTTAVNNEFTISVYVANVATITANISNAGLVSREEFNALVLRVDGLSTNSQKNTDDISKLGIRLTTLEQSYSNNFTNNQFTEDLGTLDDLVVTHGIFDSVNKRLVV